MNEIYKTKDIILAAVLKLERYELFRIKMNGKNKGIFEFKNVPDEFILKYDLGHVRVEPLAFNNAVKQLTTTCRRMLDRS